MPSNTEITVTQLAKLVGLPDAPTVIDVRIQDDLAAEPRIIPTSVIRPYQSFQSTAAAFEGCKVVIVCQKGLKLSQGVAALLRNRGIRAETLEGGIEAWRNAGAPMLRNALAPATLEKTVWVTRARPKVDRIACPWLIKRFIDPGATFLFVGASEVKPVAERFGAIPFDINDTFWSHRDDHCTFDIMINEFDLTSPAMDRLALIVRAADTAQPDLAPQASGLLAISLGLSRMFRDDLQQPDAGMTVYDALYRWCRDAADEGHHWPVNITANERGSK